jgi:hypothetical protein
LIITAVMARTERDFPEEIIAMIIDVLWPDTLIGSHFSRYLDLLLVNRTFHKVVMRKRDVMMMAQAMLLRNLKGYDLVTACEGRRPFSNPFVNKAQLLMNFMSLPSSLSDHYEKLEEIGKLLYREASWVCSQTKTVPYPLMLAYGRGDDADVIGTSHCTRLSSEDEDEDEEDLMRSISCADIDANYEESWEYGLYSWSDWEPQHGTLFLFRRYHCMVPGAPGTTKESMLTESHENVRSLFTADC